MRDDDPVIGTGGTSRPADVADVRTTNLTVVLQHVRRHAPCSRSEIAGATGLTKATVSSLVAELIDRRLVHETGTGGTRLGRPATALEAVGGQHVAAGLLVSGDQLTVVAVDLAGTTLLSWRRAYGGPATPGGRPADEVAALVRKVVTALRRRGKTLRAVSAAAPGVPDPQGTIRFPGHLGWPDLPLGDLLRQTLRRRPVDILVDSEAALTALAEQRRSAAPAGDMVCLVGGVTIEAGIVAGGRVVRGAHGLAGRIGHLTLDPAGPACGCGRRGCLEAYAGLPALIRAALPDTRADDVTGDLLPDLQRLAALAEAGDPACRGALAEAGRRLGQAAAVLAEVLDPATVILGGRFGPLGPWLTPAAEAEAHARTRGGTVAPPRIVASGLDPEAAAAGGAEEMLDRMAPEFIEGRR